MYEYDKGEALAQRVALACTTGLGVAVLLMAVVAPPAEAKKNAKQPEKNGRRSCRIPITVSL